MIVERQDRRILFVDDEKNVLRGLKRALHGDRAAWVAEFVESGEEALEAMQRARFDMIVADMQMPGMGGEELLLHVLTRWPKTVRFALSGHTDREMVLKAAGISHQFFAKPCDVRRLKVAMGRVFASQQLLAKSPDMQALVSGTETLPVLPETFAGLVETLGTGWGESYGDLCDVVSRDVSVAAKIMNLAQWVSFGPSRRARSIEQCLGFLGPELLRKLFFSTELFREWNPQVLSQYPVREICRHSMACGALAEQIALTLCASPQLAASARMAGVLHDVGKLVLIANKTREYEVVMEESRDTGQDLARVERTMFGVSHAEIGGALLSLWGVSKPIAVAVTYHHEPAACGHAARIPTIAVHAADLIMKNIEKDGYVEQSVVEHLCAENQAIRRLLPKWNDLALAHWELAHESC